MTADIADSLGLKKAAGAMVDEPQSGSPAAKAGIQSGDVITAVNGAPVKDARELARAIGTMAPDTSVKLDIVRNSEPRTITVTLAQMPNEQRPTADIAMAQSQPVACRISGCNWRRLVKCPVLATRVS